MVAQSGFCASQKQPSICYLCLEVTAPTSRETTDLSLHTHLFERQSQLLLQGFQLGKHPISLALSSRKYFFHWESIWSWSTEERWAYPQLIIVAFVSGVKTLHCLTSTSVDLLAHIQFKRFQIHSVCSPVSSLELGQNMTS